MTATGSVRLEERKTVKLETSCDQWDENVSLKRPIRGGMARAARRMPQSSPLHSQPRSRCRAAPR